MAAPRLAAVAGALAALCLGGCAQRFGYDVPQVLVAVNSAKPDRVYYVIPFSDAGRFFGTEQRTVAASPELEKILADQDPRETNDPPYQYESGSYALIIKCDQAYKTVRLAVPDTGNMTVTVDCNGA